MAKEPALYDPADILSVVQSYLSTWLLSVPAHVLAESGELHLYAWLPRTKLEVLMATAVWHADRKAMTDVIPWAPGAVAVVSGRKDALLYGLHRRPNVNGVGQRVQLIFGGEATPIDVVDEAARNDLLLLIQHKVLDLTARARMGF